MVHSVKIKVHNPKESKGSKGTSESTGFAGRKFSADEKKKIQEETTAALLQGNKTRVRNRDLGIEDNQNLDEATTLLLSKINRLGQNKKFKTIKNKPRLEMLVKELPDVDLEDISLPILKAIIDNVPFRDGELTDKEELEFYKLSDQIFANKFLAKQFTKHDLLTKYNDPKDLEEAFDDFDDYSKQADEIQDQYIEHGREMYQKAAELAEQSGRDPSKFKEFKALVPEFQRAYNISRGFDPRMSTTRLGPEKINDVMGYKEFLDHAQKVKAKKLENDEEIERISSEIEEKLEKHNEIEAEIVEVKEIIQQSTDRMEDIKKIVKKDFGGKSMGQFEEYMDIMEKEIKSLEAGQGHIRFSKRSTLETLKASYENSMGGLNKYSKARAERDRAEERQSFLNSRLGEVTSELELLYKAKDKLGGENTNLNRSFVGQGLTRKKSKSSPWGRLKNGRPRKHKPRMTGGNIPYKPRNKFHWMMKKDEQGKFIGGSIIDINEVKSKLINCKNNNQQQKALDMLDSISDILSKKQYDEILSELLS